MLFFGTQADFDEDRSLAGRSNGVKKTARLMHNPKQEIRYRNGAGTGIRDSVPCSWATDGLRCAQGFATQHANGSWRLKPTWPQKRPQNSTKTPDPSIEKALFAPKCRFDAGTILPSRVHTPLPRSVCSLLNSTAFDDRREYDRA